MWGLKAAGDSGYPARGRGRSRLGPEGGTLVLLVRGRHPGPAQSPADPGLAGDLRDLTARRSKCEGEGFVLRPGRVGCWLESL